MMFKYVIRAEGNMALVVQTEMNWLEFPEYIRKRTRKLHPKGHDTVYRYGVTEFINPVVMTLEDYANFCPALM
jgi:hypothetical protein